MKHSCPIIKRNEEFVISLANEELAYATDCCGVRSFDMGKANLRAYVHGNFYGLGKRTGKFGWSVQKKKK
jgi:flavin reductase (DIM6/NTAB) family NADH-FMN oxidoreductase RutF